MITLSNEINISPERVYETYKAITLHFKKDSNYDAFKFSFKGPRMKRESLESSKNKWTLEKLARTYPRKNDLILYFLANTLAGNSWIGGMSAETYQEWLGKIQRLDYTFKTEMSNLAEICNERHLTFDQAIMPSDHSDFPLIYTLHQRKELSLESLVILESLISFTKGMYKITDPLEIISDISNKIQKYMPFLRSEMKSAVHKKIALDIFTR